MKENDWRSKLVRYFKSASTNGFIWVNDVRYKAGFPDIYIVKDSIARHYELKLCNEDNFKDQMSPIQDAVCKKLSYAGVHVSCLTYMPKLEKVYVTRFIHGVKNEPYDLNMMAFHSLWIRGCLI